MAVRSWLVGHKSNENTYFPGVSQTYKGLTKSGVALYKRVKFKPPFSAKNRGVALYSRSHCTRINTVTTINCYEIWVECDKSDVTFSATIIDLLPPRFAL